MCSIHVACHRLDKEKHILCLLLDLIIIPYKIYAYTASLFIKIKRKESLGILDSIKKEMSNVA